MNADWETVTRCSGCDTKNLEMIWDFKNVPLAGYFPTGGTENLKNLIPC